MRNKPISNNAICPLFMRIVFFNTNGTCIILIISVCMLRVLICLYTIYKENYYTPINYLNAYILHPIHAFCNACDCSSKKMAFKPETQETAGLITCFIIF